MDYALKRARISCLLPSPNRDIMTYSRKPKGTEQMCNGFERIEDAPIPFGYPILHLPD
jgi:hypothetical protein